MGIIGLTNTCCLGWNGTIGGTGIIGFTDDPGTNVDGTLICGDVVIDFGIIIGDTIDLVGVEIYEFEIIGTTDAEVFAVGIINFGVKTGEL